MKEIVKKIENLVEKNQHIKPQDEADVENVWVEPFLEILGYDPRNPQSVKRHYKSNFVDTKGTDKKVDYAILQDGAPIVIVEVKHCESRDFNRGNKNHKSPLEQLSGYFASCVRKGCKFGILTNGAEYRFYSDLQEKNMMDNTPFLMLNLEHLSENECEILALFKNGVLAGNIDKIKEKARQKSKISQIKERLKNIMDEPGKDEYKVFLQIFKDITGKQNLQARAKDNLAKLIKQAFAEIISEKNSEKISANFSENIEKISSKNAENFSEKYQATDEEKRVFKLVKSLLKDDRIDFVKTKKYMSIGIKKDGKIIDKSLLCRFYRIGKKFQIGTDNKQKISLDDIHKFEPKLKERLKNLR